MQEDGFHWTARSPFPGDIRTEALPAASWSSVNLKGNGIAVFGTLTVCDHPDGQDVCDDSKGTFTFAIPGASVADYQRVLKAVLHLAELNGANLQENNLF